MTANHYSSAPIEDPTLAAMRCYEDAAAPIAAVSSVAAGSKIVFKASNTMGHPGPVLFYMAKVPSGQNVTTWKADGAVWFKISQQGANIDASGVHFQTGMSSINTTIPSALPAGNYLLRAEHIAL
jgi:hypothetical protein